MKTPDFRQEEGQSLIQVALMLVVLIGFVGLALDGGNLYAERRRMQNAADAGALAGAWAMCKVNDPAAAKAKAVAYMQKNGDLDAAVGNVDIVGYKVTAHASKPVTPFLPFTFGGSVDVPATASAACGAANKACGVWPMGVPSGDWDSYESASCSTGKKIAIWLKDGQRNGNKDAPVSSCKLSDGTVKTKICDCYQCKYQGSDIYLRYGNTASAFLDFSQIPNIVTGETAGPGCGTNELVNNFTGTPSIPVALGQCITEVSGVRSLPQVMDAIDTRAGDTIAIPLYDNQTCTGASCNGGINRHISGFGCVTVNQNASNQAAMPIILQPTVGATENKPGNAKLLGPANITVVMLTMNCNNACVSSCGSTDGSPPDSNGDNAANLVP